MMESAGILFICSAIGLMLIAPVQHTMACLRSAPRELPPGGRD